MIKKKMLFIAPTFFGYYKEIRKELEEQNIEVDYFADIPSNSNLQKAIGRINKNFIKNSVNQYFKKDVIPVISSKKYDFVFVIVGMTFSFSKEIIKEIKTKNPSAIFIMYQWDGEKNIKFVNEIHDYFDRIYTFDRIDALDNNKYKFLPLFYTKNYENVGSKKNIEFEYDASYIGTAHPQKFKLINEMSENVKEILEKQYIYHYMPSILKFIYHKLTSKEYKKVEYKDLKHEKLSFDETMEIFKKSRCIFDAPQAGQNGLTIRTIECIGAKRKIITTNKDIINYDFYNPKNIYIYNGSVDKDNIFFKEQFEELPRDIYEKYSLKNWIKTIIEN